MTAPTTAMVLAAGLGTRMRPLTNDRPKALVEVGGRTLVDHMLDRLKEQGVTRVVVNVHAFADRLEAHLKARRDLDIVISDERDLVLETGGGLKKARPLLGDDPIWVCNIDSVWQEGETPAMQALARTWDPARMDDILLLAPLDRSLGFDGSGDFFLQADGRLERRGDRPTAPFAYMGVHICKPQIVDGGPEGAWSMNLAWNPLLAEGRMFGVAMDGFWMHVGDPVARDATETRLTGRTP